MHRNTPTFSLWPFGERWKKGRKTRTGREHRTVSRNEKFGVKASLITLIVRVIVFFYWLSVWMVHVFPFFWYFLNSLWPFVHVVAFPCLLTSEIGSSNSWETLEALNGRRWFKSVFHFALLSLTFQCLSLLNLRHCSIRDDLLTDTEKKNQLLP